MGDSWLQFFLLGGSGSCSVGDMPWPWVTSVQGLQGQYTRRTAATTERGTGFLHG